MQPQRPRPEIEFIRCAMALPVLVSDNRREPPQAPTEFRIFGPGENDTDYGRFVFDEVSAQSVMAKIAQRRVDLMMDYEHMSVHEPPIIAPASAKVWVAEVRATAAGPELWATKIQWTERAKALIESGEYRYFSPVFAHDKKTRRILTVVNVALTNEPGMHGIQPLLAARADLLPITTQENDTMISKTCKACLKAIKLRSADTETEEEDEVYCKSCGTKEHGQSTAALKALGLGHDASEEQIVAAGSEVVQLRSAAASGEKLRTDLLAVSGTTDVTVALSSVAGWRKDSEELVKLRAETATTEQKRLRSEVDTYLGEACKAGKITPAQKDIWLGDIVREGKVDEARLIFCRQQLDGAPVVALRRELHEQPSGLLANEAERRVAEINGHSVEPVMAFKARQIAASRTP